MVKVVALGYNLAAENADISLKVSAMVPQTSRENVIPFLAMVSITRKTKFLFLTVHRSHSFFWNVFLIRVFRNYREFSFKYGLNFIHCFS